MTEEFIRSHEELLLFCIYSLVQAAFKADGAVDSDVVAALEALIQTHRTLESGLVYETRPENSIAASVQRSFAASLADYEKLQTDAKGWRASGTRTSWRFSCFSTDLVSRTRMAGHGGACISTCCGTWFRSREAKNASPASSYEERFLH